MLTLSKADIQSVFGARKCLAEAPVAVAEPPASGLIGWFKPESLGAPGSAVSMWPNSVAGGPDAVQATALRRPAVADNVLDGFKAVYVDPAGSSPAGKILSIATAGNRNSLTFITVVRKTADFGLSLRTHFGMAAGAATFYGHTGRDQLYAGTTYAPFQVRPTGLWQMKGFSTDGAELQFIRNGAVHNPYGGEQALIGAGNARIAGPTSSPYTALSLLNDNPVNGSTATRGYMAEALIWNRKLTREELAIVTAYLDAKYPSLLPSDNNVVCVGDSLTFGLGALSNEDYPTKLAMIRTDCHVTNWGWSGRWTAQELTTAPTYLLPSVHGGGMLYPRSRRNVLCIWFGANDLAPQAGNQKVSQMQDAITTLIASARAAGWNRIGISTVIPRGDAPEPADASANDGNGNFEWRRAQYNQWVLAGHSGADVVVDPTVLPEFDNAADYLDTNIYNADKVHLKGAGYALIANLWKDALNALV